MHESTSDAEKLDQIISYLKNVEKRISRLESRFESDVDFSENEIKLPEFNTDNISERADSIENQIGQFWFAKVGIVILSIGIIYLLTFPYQKLPSSFPSLIGFILVGVLFWLSYYLRQSLQYLAQYVFGGALLLLYFTTLRLHYFGVNPVLENNLIEITLLIFVTIVHLYISFRKKSVYLNGIGIALACITTLISNNTYSVFLFSSLIALFIIFLKFKFEWSGLFVYGITLVYITNLIWFINNPLLGNPIALGTLPLLSILSIPLFAIIFASGNFFRSEIEIEDIGVIVSTIINCLWCYTIFLLITITGNKNLLPFLHIMTSVIFLSIAALFWIKRKSKFTTFFYSITGYTALSVGIIAQFPKPDFFIWLCWQSLLVVSTALWFRSKIIIVANFIMYLLIFLSYLFIAGTLGAVTLSFGIVALTTARILNWQKNRLDFKTEVMRLSYLIAAFFIFPYALYHIVPKEFVSLAWTIVAIIYYVLSVVLKSRKYRWMALFTFVLTILYILFVGTSSLEPIYRIISFIVLGMVLLAISIFYGKMKSSTITKN